MVSTLYSLIDNKDIIYNAPCKELCTYRLGGCLEYLVCPKTLDDFCKYLKTLDIANIKYKVLGNMSNILPADGQIKGVYITTRYIADKPNFFGNRVTVSCGYSLSALVIQSCKNGLSGLQGLIGIPATIGGAVTNNAGAYGYQISDTLESLLVYKNGKVVSEPVSYAKLGYRQSVFCKTNEIVLQATFCLNKANADSLLNETKQIALKRADSQPNLPSAGSIFKKHNNCSAGLLIDKAGLKGTIYKGAQISEKHANFIVNLGTATSESVKYLINLAQTTIKQQFDITLEREVEFLGEINENTSRLSYT